MSFLIKVENRFFKKKIYACYEDARRDCLNKGYEDDDLARTVYVKVQSLRRDLTRDCWRRVNITRALATLISVLRGFDGEASVLDFGGGCGAAYFVIKKILGESYKLNWMVTETKAMCKYKENLENGELKFSDDIRAAMAGMPDLDVINVSGALQYVDRPYRSLDCFFGSGSKFILFSRMCFTAGNRDIITTQKTMLSWHGGGKLPLGNRDKEIRCPFTVIQKSRFDDLARQRYQYLKVFPDDSGVIRINHEPVFGLGLLCEYKSDAL